MTQLMHLNPAGLHQNPAFSQAVSVRPGSALVFIGGQNGTDQSGEVVSDQPEAQARQALENVRIAVESAGGTLADIAKWTILVTDRAHLGPGFEAFTEFWDQADPPPAIGVQVVSGLANPDFLVEIEAIAAMAPNA